MPENRTPDVRRWSRRIASLLCLVIMASWAPAVSAQVTNSAGTENSSATKETTARKITPTSFGTLPPAMVVLPKLPSAFSKPVPESIDDLRKMEAHVQSLVPKLTETTVALTVGVAQGSGVIVGEDGYVLTAAHVSGSAGHRVQITLSDGTRAFGHSLGRNKTLDASLIKIDKPVRKWPYVGMAKFSDIGVGNWSIVMGHPGGYQPDRQPVFRLGRVIHVDEQVIQTDNELVGGDSGGPLFDMHGQVIGINSRIGPATSFNLHTPINAYTDNWDRLVASEEFILHSGALLGVHAESSELGLRLTEVSPNEAAERAGLKVGDVVLRFQSTRVRDLDHLIELIGENEPGRRVTVRILRDDKVLDVPVKLGARE